MNVKDVQNSTILVVDDNLEILNVLCEYLRLREFTVFLCERGEDALEMTDKHKPNIILLDILMPGFNGFEVCRRLKENDDTKDIPVIFTSALTETIDKVKGFDIGGVDYITKPFQYEEVVARIAAHLRLRNLQKSLQENNMRLHQEIAQRKQAEKALRESEERFRTIFEHTPVMINSYDEQDGYQLWNSECERRLGYTKDEIMAYEDSLSLLYPDSHIRSQVIADISKADGIFREYSVTSKDGSVLVQLWANFCLPAGVTISVGHDITERKQAEEALLESQQYAHNIIESSLNMIITVDQERRIVEFNKAAEKAFGYQREEVVGKNINILYAVQEESFAIHQTMVAEQQSIREVFNKRKNGKVFPCLLSASILRDAHGEPIGYMGISRDITALKKAQTELMTAHDDLKEKNEQLQELNASKDKFFSIISHDLRGAFGALLGFSQLITENIDAYSKDRVKTLVARLRTCAERLYALLENLLTWSRIQRGVIEYAPKIIDLFKIANENVELFATRAEQKQITLKSTIQEGTMVHADPSMVNTVVRNLISNGLKFTSADGSINVSSTDHDDHFVAVSVSDTGVGIPEEVLPRLLRIDTQYTHIGTAGEQGTGLGLILCKELVEQNGGNLLVESKVGKGTNFTFTLPKQPLT